MLQGILNSLEKVGLVEIKEAPTQKENSQVQKVQLPTITNPTIAGSFTQVNEQDPDFVLLFQKLEQKFLTSNNNINSYFGLKKAMSSLPANLISEAVMGAFAAQGVTKEIISNQFSQTLSAVDRELETFAKSAKDLVDNETSAKDLKITTVTSELNELRNKIQILEQSLETLVSERKEIRDKVDLKTKTFVAAAEKIKTIIQQELTKIK